MEETLLKLVFVLCCCQQIVSGEVDWCSLSCADGTQNTMCKYKPNKDAGVCQDMKMFTTPKARRILLDGQNRLRDDIASGTKKEKMKNLPPAGNMRQMSWDDDLERLAYRWAQQCPMPSEANLFSPNDDCRRTPVFENVAQDTDVEPLSEDADDFAEDTIFVWKTAFLLALVHPEKFVDDPSLEMQKFARMLNAGTYKIGCSMVKTKAELPSDLSKTSRKSRSSMPGHWKFRHTGRNSSKGSARSPTTAVILVCNYAPGYKEGEPVYDRKATAACETCPPETKCYEDSAYKHLCALESDDRQPKDIPGPPEISGSGSLKMPKMKLLDPRFLTVFLSGILSSLVHRMSK